MKIKWRHDIILDNESRIMQIMERYSDNQRLIPFLAFLTNDIAEDEDDDRERSYFEGFI
jgi:hypothetical protein